MSARLSLAIAGGLLAASLQADDILDTKAPMAKKVEKIDTVHGDRVVDDYFWLRDRKDPEVRAYLEAENTYADSVMKPTVALQEELYQEMLARIKETDLSVPYREGAFFYYSRTEQGKQYPIYCRKKQNLDAPEQVLLDLNEMARGERFMAVQSFEISDDANLLAYTTDKTGFREYTLHVRDLATGKDLPETVEKVSSVAWAADNRTLFYTVDDRAKRPYRMYRHALRSDPRSDVLIFEEKDEMFRVQVERSRSRAMLFLASGSHTADEWRYLPADKPEGSFTLVLAREKNHEYAVGHHGNLFYIRTNKDCRNFRVVTAAVGRTDVSSLERVPAVPPRRDGRGHRSLRPSRGDPRARGWIAPDPSHRSRLTRPTPDPIPRGGLLDQPAGERRVRHHRLPLQLSIVYDAALRLRLRHELRRNASSSKRRKSSAATRPNVTRPSGGTRPLPTARRFRFPSFTRRGSSPTARPLSG